MLNQNAGGPLRILIVDDAVDVDGRARGLPARFPRRADKRDGVPRIAVDDKGRNPARALFGERKDIKRVQGKRIVAGPGDVDALDGGNLLGTRRCQIERKIRAVERQRIGAGSAVDIGEGKVGHGYAVVPGAAANHVRPAVSGQRIVPGAADEGVRCGGSNEGLRRRQDNRSAIDNVAFPGQVAAVIAVRRADEKIIKTVAVDVAGPRNAKAGKVSRRVAPDNETDFGAQRRQIDDAAAGAVVDAETIAGSEQHIGAASIVAGFVVRRRADDNIGEAVAVDVPGVGDALAEFLAGIGGLNDKAFIGAEIGERDCLAACAIWRAKGLVPAIDHIRLTGIAARRAVDKNCADHNVVETVAIDVAGRGDAAAQLAGRLFAEHDETVLPGQSRNVDQAAHAEAARLSEHHIGFAGVRRPAGGPTRTDDNVGEPVAINVPGRSNVPAGITIVDVAPDNEAVGRRQKRHVEDLPTAGQNADTGADAEKHIGFPGAIPAVIIVRRADDEIVEAVAVDVAGRGDAAAQLIVGGVASDDEAVIGREVSNRDHLAAVRCDNAEIARFPVHDIGLAGVLPRIVAEHRADNEVGEAVAVDVPGAGNAPAQLVSGNGVAGDEEAG